MPTRISSSSSIPPSLPSLSPWSTRSSSLLRAVAGNVMHFFFVVVCRRVCCGRCRCRRCALTSPPPPGNVIVVVTAAAALNAGRRRRISRRGLRPCCTSWQAIPCISRRAPASPPPPPPSGYVIVVVAIATLTAGWRLCCCHAPSEDGVKRRQRTHHRICLRFCCHYLSSCPHVLSLVSHQKTLPNPKTLDTSDTSLQKTGSFLCSEVSDGYK